MARKVSCQETFNSSKANATSLRFPSEQDVGLKERVPYEAMDLINSLLQEREHRLCSKQYGINDFQNRTRPKSQLRAAHADEPPQDYQGHYVYPNDAVDIKAHPFFHDLSWDTLHLTQPPFIPDIRSEADTKYFDDDEISDVDDGSSEQELLEPLNSVGDSMVELLYKNEPNYSAPTRHQGQRMTMYDKPNAQTGTNGSRIANEKCTRRKERKRPRDRVLRDKQVGRKVLEVRKRGAFLGYAYQRPATVMFDDERGRQKNAY